MLIGEKIKNLRKNKRLTQEELGKLINTDGNTVSRWERDKLGVGSAYVAKLAEALETTTDYLLNGEKSQPEAAPKNPGGNLPINNMPENEIVEIRGIKIDKTARRVWINGEEKSFTTKEFDLLTFLAENPNHVFTKEELFKRIWDMDSIGDIATVTVHIKKIREKIEKETSKPQYIETIWGVGYRFKL